MTSVSRLLVTGGAGFVGLHVLRTVRRRLSDWQVCAWTLNDSPLPLPPPIDGVEWALVDIENPQAVQSAIRDFEPTHVIHLAAASHVGSSFANPRKTWSVNVMGTLNLLDALHKTTPTAKLVLVSSSEVYGESFKTGRPLAEDAPVKPRNPYAASKAAAELLASSYTKTSLVVFCVRPFNHIGAGQNQTFAISSFAHQLASIGEKLQPPTLRVGNLENQRDFLDVRDVVDAYVSLIERADKLPPGLTLNLCSGETRRVGDVLTELIAESGINVQTIADPKLIRPSDTPVAEGTAALARKHLGWSPKIPFAETLRWVLADALTKVRRSSASIGSKAGGE